MPAAFLSGRGAKKDNKEVGETMREASGLPILQQARDEKAKDHENAVFGPAWRSKELTKKLNAQESKKAAAAPTPDIIPLPSGINFDSNFADFPLAKHWVSRFNLRLAFVG